MGSTSTIRTTALPSRTFLTLSASQFFLRGDVDDDEEEPEKASQNAEPSLLTSVCDAIDASIACCSVGVGCDCEVDEDARDEGWANVRGGEGGGDGYAFAAALPESRADKVGLLLKYCGRILLASPLRGGVEDCVDGEVCCCC